MRAPALPTLAVVAFLALAGCGKNGGTGSSGPTQKATVKAGDTTCDVSPTTFAAGSVTVQVQNAGTDVTEVYVYGKGSSGAFDTIVGEVENIAPGTGRAFDVKVGGGTYEVTCKPGQKGNGIRTKIEVSGAASTATEAAYDREVAVEATDFAFSGLKGFTAKVGEKIEFKLENKGQAQHNLTFFDASGSEVGSVDTTEPGKDAEAVVTFAKAGTYTYKCTIDGHADKGMEGTFTVA